MTEITIPAAALEAGARKQAKRDNVDWDQLNDIAKQLRIEDARACFLAMLAAWPGAKTIRDDGRRQTYAIPAIILPLPQEASDDK